MPMRTCATYLWDDVMDLVHKPCDITPAYEPLHEALCLKVLKLVHVLSYKHDGRVKAEAVATDAGPGHKIQDRVGTGAFKRRQNESKGCFRFSMLKAPNQLE